METHVFSGGNLRLFKEDFQGQSVNPLDSGSNSSVSLSDRPPLAQIHSDPSRRTETVREGVGVGRIFPCINELGCRPLQSNIPDTPLRVLPPTSPAGLQVPRSIF